jgi:hypothetical protein
MPKSREYQILLYAFTQDGCPLCRLIYQSTYRFLDAWKYELFTDADLREELRSTQGFCHTHTWQLVHMGAILPLAQAYRDIISDTIEHIQNGTEHSPQATGGLFRRFFETRSAQMECPACRRKISAEKNFIHTLREALLDEAFYDQFTNSHGLCLEHFRQACTLKLPEVTGDWLTPLRQAQLVCLRHLDEQLKELVRKHDYRFKDESHGSEMLSWRRAAGLVAGEEDQII